MRRDFRKIPSVKFHKDRLGGSRIVTCGQTDTAKRTESFKLLVVNAQKTNLS
jgi:hypothetical protein